MTEKLSITDVLEGYKACDIDTLALRTGHSLQVVEAMLTNLMRKKQVKLVNGLYQLTNASVKGNDKLEPKPEPKPKPKKLEQAPKSDIKIDVDAGSSNKKQNQSKVQSSSQERRTLDGLRNVLQQSGREMRASELAEATGFISGTIGTLLRDDIERGDVICEPKEADIKHGDIVYRRKGVRFYRWASDEDKKDKQLTSTPESTSTSALNPNPDTEADTDTDTENCTYIYVQNGTQAKPVSTSELEVAMEPKAENGNINVPNSASLRAELDEINSCIEELTQAQHHKSEMLHLVIKLEELIGSGR